MSRFGMFQTWAKVVVETFDTYTLCQLGQYQNMQYLFTFVPDLWKPIFSHWWWRQPRAACNQAFAWSFSAANGSPEKKTTSGVFRAKAFISLANGIWQRMSSEMLRRTDGIQWVYLVLPASPGEFLEEKNSRVAALSELTRRKRCCCNWNWRQLFPYWPFSRFGRLGLGYNSVPAVVVNF